ncbi:MAG: RluA family pseudouridine synthase [Christensenellaceae bacterium]|nr:RluA family pseudouridine synthase [Christensenellaceae bacterium]MDD6926656.1 RluA family pseudouridine synthase [bacterium]MDY2851378.1 RluA family pseudouridine synthase [Christensenellaceae bacterium]
MSINDLVILYEDNHIIVVLKPQNVPSQGDDSKDPDMLSLVKEYIKETYKKEGNVYVGLVHRLDRPTGGVMVFAKSSKAAARLSEQLKAGDFEKKYFAVLCGVPREKKAVLTNYLKKNAVNNMVYVCGPTVEGAKLAELDYKILQETNDLSLAEIRLHTGRSHQIRVQMNFLGTPVYGDMRYGGEKAKKGYLALWAYSLSFTHPVLKERMVFKVQPPVDVKPWNEFDLEKPFLYINPKNA